MRSSCGFVFSRALHQAFRQPQKVLELDLSRKNARMPKAVWSTFLCIKGLMLNPVNPATPTDPPPHVGFQSLQSHTDHRRNVVVNPKSLSYCIIAGDTNDSIDPRSKSPMVHDYVGQPGIKKANIPRSIMDKGATDRRRTKRRQVLVSTEQTSGTPTHKRGKGREAHVK